MQLQNLDALADKYAGHPVVSALRTRRAAGSKPGARADDHKIGLAVQGGGMRGVVSAAMVAAIEDLRFLDSFDVVYGCSSGANNAAYLLAGDCWYGLTIYFDELTTSRFVDFTRPLRGRSILDIHYAFDNVMERVKPLHYESVISSPIPLSVSITLVDKRTSTFPTKFSSKSDLKEALMAGAWIPIGVGGTATFRGERALDGGVLRPHPYRVALDDGCTHVLSLSTKPRRPPRRRISPLENVGRIYLNRLKRGLGDDYICALEAYRGERSRLNESLDDHNGPPYLLDLTPPAGTHEIKREETRQQPLVQAAREAYQVVLLALEQRRDGVVLRLTPPPASQQDR